MRRLRRLFSFLIVMFWYAARMVVSGIRLNDREKARRIAMLQQKGGRSLCRVLGVEVSVSGEQDACDGTLIVSNHIGLLDPWVLASVFPIAFVAKIEMATWPLISWVGRSTGLIYVDRKNKMKTRSFVESVQSRMRFGVGVLVFPEGTTNANIELLPFKTGSFASVEYMSDGHVLPVYLWAKALDGRKTDITSRLQVSWPEAESMWRNAWKMVGYGSIHIEVIIGASIPADGRSRKELAQLAKDQVDRMRRSTF